MTAGELSPLFDWRSAVASKYGPESSTTRHVLLTLSLWMSVKGDGCYPSTRTLAEASGLSRRSVETHLATAISEGWIARDQHGFSGQGWKRYEYAAKIPRSVLAAIQAEKKGGEGDSPRTSEGGEPRDKKVGKEVPTSTPLELSIETTNGALPAPSDLKRNGKGYVYPDAFEVVWAAYPARRGNNPKKGAYRNWRRLVREGVDRGLLLAAVEDYAAWVRAEGIEGQRGVMMMQSFFGPEAEPWAQDWGANAEAAAADGEVEVGSVEWLRREQERGDEMARESSS